MEVKFSLLKSTYEDISSRVRNKRKVMRFDQNKIEYLISMKEVLENNTYDGGRYNIFLVFRPKIRVVMSQGVYDKVINHYITRYILIPKLGKYLSDRNCATRENMGISYAIKLLKKDIESFKKYDNFYFLKLDIKKYFYSIDHEVLLSLVKDDLSTDEYELIKRILNSTNKKYVNKVISYFEEKYNVELPRYETGKGLPIGNMTSQFLAVFYLSKLQHFIRHDLHLKYVNYMDDYIIIHEDKEYLKECLKIIESKLINEYKLNINKNKTYIVNSKEGINFLGYNIKVINKKTIVKLSRSAKKNTIKGIRRLKYQYENNIIDFKSFFGGVENYKNGYQFANRNVYNNLFERNWY